MADDSALISSLVLGNAAATTVILRERAEHDARREAEAAAREESLVTSQRQASASVEARALQERQLGALVLLVAALGTPVVIGFIHGSSQNSFGTMFIGWIIGLGVGLGLWALAARAAGDDMAWFSSFLGSRGAYVVLGFFLYIAAGTIASGLSS